MSQGESEEFLQGARDTVGKASALGVNHGLEVQPASSSCVTLESDLILEEIMHKALNRATILHFVWGVLLFVSNS